MYTTILRQNKNLKLPLEKSPKIQTKIFYIYTNRLRENFFYFLDSSLGFFRTQDYYLIKFGIESRKLDNLRFFFLEFLHNYDNYWQQ